MSYPLRLNRRRGVAVLGLAVIVLISLVGAAWRDRRASAPVSEHLFEQDDGMKAIKAAHLVQTVNLRQTVQGVTITLHGVYADEHRILLSFTTNHPLRAYRVDVQDIDVSTDTLANDDRLTSWDQRSFSGTAQQLDTGGCGWLPPCRETGTMQVAEWRDDLALNPAKHTTSSGNAPLLRHLRVTARAIVSQPEDSYFDPTDTPPIGPFVFDLNTVLHPAHRVEVHQAVHAPAEIVTWEGMDGPLSTTATSEPVADFTVTLEEIEMTPSTIRARLCTNPSDPEAWWPNVALVTNTGQQLEMDSGGDSFQPACTILSGYGTGHDPSGQWTVTVTSLGKYQYNVEGTWRFQVTIP